MATMEVMEEVMVMEDITVAMVMEDMEDMVAIMVTSKNDFPLKNHYSFIIWKWFEKILFQNYIIFKHFNPIFPLLTFWYGALILDELDIR